MSSQPPAQSSQGPAYGIFLGFQLDPTLTEIIIYTKNSQSPKVNILTLNLNQDHGDFTKWKIAKNIPSDHGSVRTRHWYNFLANYQHLQPLSSNTLFAKNIEIIEELRALKLIP